MEWKTEAFLILIHVLSQVNVDGEERSLGAFWKGSNDLKPKCVHNPVNCIGVLLQYFKYLLYVDHWLEI